MLADCQRLEGGSVETFLNAGSMMVVLFITVALGYIARKTDLVDDAFDSTLSKVVVYITCPALILDSVLGNENLPPNEIIWQVFGVSLLLYLAVAAIALGITRLYPIPEGQRSSHAFTITFSNVAFVGFAVCAAILGSDSLLYLSIYNLLGTILIWTLGAWMISRSGTVKLSRREQLAYVKRNLATPTTAASIAALVLALLHVTDSGIIGYTCHIDTYSALYIPTYTQSHSSLTVEKQEAWRSWVLKVYPVGFVHSFHNLVGVVSCSIVVTTYNHCRLMMCRVVMRSLSLQYNVCCKKHEARGNYFFHNGEIE